ncbi:dihydroorotase [Guggenheimella bovis]
MKTIVGGLVLDWSQKKFIPKNVIIDGRKIKEVSDRTEGDIIDAKGLHVIPGLIDVHTHMREPGFTHKATFLSEGRASAKGGFTHVFAMPNTNPAPDSVENYETICDLTKKSPIRVTIVASATRGSQGAELGAIEELSKKGVTVFSDDGRPIMDGSMMEKVMEVIHRTGGHLLLHEEDLSTFTVGAINRGFVSELLGLDGIPNEAESNMVKRDIDLLDKHNIHLHFCHISTKESLAFIREAKKKGYPVTCEACAHHFTFTDEEVLRVGGIAKVNPPLRSKEDVEAVIESLQDGTVDMIASDHAPHELKSKFTSLERASYGLSGIEFSLSLGIKELVETGKMDLVELIRLMSKAPSECFGLEGEGSIEAGSFADIVLFDPKESWKATYADMLSMGKNTPVLGMELKGRVKMTIVGGEVVYEETF